MANKLIPGSFQPFLQGHFGGRLLAQEKHTISFCNACRGPLCRSFTVKTNESNTWDRLEAKRAPESTGFALMSISTNLDPRLKN